MSVSVTLSDLERRDANGQLVQADLSSYAGIVWPRMTNFGVVTQVVKWRISTGSTTLPSQWVGPSVSETIGDPPRYARTVLSIPTKFGMVTYVGGVFQHGQAQGIWVPPSPYFGTSYTYPHGMTPVWFSLTKTKTKTKKYWKLKLN